MEFPLPAAIKPTPLVSWRNIRQMLIGRPRVDGKIMIVLGLFLSLVLQATGSTCPCVITTRQGSREQQTLTYKSIFNCVGNIASCTKDKVEYKTPWGLKLVMMILQAGQRIYMLNRIIRLQAVVELLTRENEQALLLLAKQNTQIRNAIYQNRLALDYLLASEGGLCGKFNLTNC